MNNENVVDSSSNTLFLKSKAATGNTNVSQNKYSDMLSQNANAPVSHLSIGDVLKDRFILVDSLGEGGMGMVFKALDKRKQEAEDNDPYVAIKVLRPEMSADQQLFIALQRETKRTQQLSHPNIIRVFDFDRDGGHIFMSMEYLTGQTLAQLIKSSAPFSLDAAWPIIEAMGNALACAHNNQIVHNDFKPSNVFINQNGKVKILDFGIASKFNSNNQDKDADQTRYNPRGLGALTEAYASLEMLEGNEQPDPSDDVYAFGCVIYQLLTGKHPFSMLSAKQVYEFNKDPQNKSRQLLPTSIPSLQSRQMEALFRALRLERSTRTNNINELLNNLSTTRPPVVNWNFMAGAVLSTVLIGTVWYYRDLLMPNKSHVQKPVQSLVNTPIQKDALVVEKIHDGTIAEPLEQVDSKPVESIAKTFPVKLAVLKASYKIGDQLSVKFNLEKPSYVRMIHRGAKGKLSDLLPNPFQPMALLKANHDYFVPPKGAKFSIDIEGPAGVDTVTIFASEQPIPASVKLIGGDGLPPPQIQNHYSWQQVKYTIEK